MENREKRIAGLRELWALIREDLKSNGTIFEPGFQALAVYRFGVWRHAIRSKALRVPFTIVYRLLYFFVRNVYGIELPVQARLGRRILIAHQHGIVVHPNAAVGNDCLLRHGVTIGQKYHTPGLPPPPAPRLGDRVLVGAGAVIIGDITVGDGAVIGPNAVVMVDVPAGAVAKAPAATIRQRGEAGADTRPSARRKGVRQANGNHGPIVLPPGMQTPDTGPLPPEIERERRRWRLDN